MKRYRLPELLCHIPYFKGVRHEKTPCKVQRCVQDDFSYPVLPYRRDVPPAFRYSGSLLAEYIYNSGDGKLTRINHSNGQKVKYLYDTLERISEIQYNSNGGDTFSTAYRYTYDANGNLYKTEDLVGNTETYCKYDHNGRLAEYVTVVPSGRGTDKSQTLYWTYYDYEGRVTHIQSNRDYYSGSVKYIDICSQNFGYDANDGLLTNVVNSYSDIEYYLYYGHDKFGRTTTVSTDMTQGDACAEIYSTITYASPDSGSGTTTTRIESVNTTYPGNISANVNSENYRYTYDANGNITEIRINNVLRYSYEYDKFGQLTRENNADTGKTVKYFYDNAGNITLKRTYSYTTASNLSGLTYTTVYYTYDSPEEYSNNYFGGLWGDLLTNYNGQEITYDADGNPLTIGDNITLEWTQGRRLSNYNLYGDIDIGFTYNSDGIRTRKTVEGITHYYTLDGLRILSEEWTTGAGSNAVRHLMVYVYDASGSPIGFRYRNSGESSGVFHEYIYGKNIQGDILYIFGLDGTLYASYVYDAWGKQSVTYYNSGNNNNLVPGVKYNPFTYRGYYYDAETGFYHTGTRYYNPEIGRFINADGQLNPGTGLIGLNLFAYCNNNPVNMADPDGNIPFFLITAAIGAVAGAVVGGIIATKNGGNVWAGIGIGAAAGGLIGLGAGAAASAMLAGSIAATTTEVVVGGAGLVSAVSAGGVGAGAAYIANNVSQSAVQSTVTELTPSVSEIRNDILDLQRVGSALKTDIYHAFTSIVDNYAGYATQTNLENATLYQLLGSLNGIDGRFEWIVQAGQVTHRFFVEGGGINGIPIMP